MIPLQMSAKRYLPTRPGMALPRYTKPPTATHRPRVPPCANSWMGGV
jgi:hypothetical protein